MGGASGSAAPGAHRLLLEVAVDVELADLQALLRDVTRPRPPPRPLVGSPAWSHQGGGGWVEGCAHEPLVPACPCARGASPAPTVLCTRSVWSWAVDGGASRLLAMRSAIFGDGERRSMGPIAARARADPGALNAGASPLLFANAATVRDAERTKADAPLGAPGTVLGSACMVRREDVEPLSPSHCPMEVVGSRVHSDRREGWPSAGSVNRLEHPWPDCPLGVIVNLERERWDSSQSTHLNCDPFASTVSNQSGNVHAMLRSQEVRGSSVEIASIDAGHQYPRFLAHR